MNDNNQQYLPQLRAGFFSRLPPTFKYVLLGLASLIALFIVIKIWPFGSVPTGQRGVITTFGKITSIHDEGLVTLWPWEKLNNFNIRAEQANVENAEGSTSDTQPVKVSMTVRYSIMTNRVAEVYEKYSHDGDLSSYVQTATQEVFKAVTARYNAPDLITKRSLLSSEISQALKTKLAVYGAQVISIDMRNFAFSPSYMAAINEKVTQEQLQLAAEKKLLTVQSEQKQKVAVATAAADAAKATADGEAYSMLKVATAQAESLKVQNAALAQNKDVLELRRIEVEMVRAKAWKGEVPTTMYGSAPIPFVTSK